ncbi:MAG: hypothetical protein IJ071_04355 [Ruminococcus sp.]|nr:hypothetical protein [Ruminococcus sp.]
MRSKKTAAGAAVVYLLLTGGLWMFVRSYASFRTRISPQEGAALSVQADHGELRSDFLGKEAVLDLSPLSSDSPGYLPAYLLVPDEVRAWVLLCRVVDEL